MHEFAAYVATLGRGPGRSRALTRDEARIAFLMVLRGEAEPVQVGAFLMLLRYRGEDAEEIAGLVEAAREAEGLGGAARLPSPALDWPSYGAGRTRDAPWFLLAALALASSGISVLMHGTNEFTTGMDVTAGLAAIGMRPAASLADAGERLAREGFAYLPAAVFAPGIARLLGLRDRLGLRSPVNTVARLLDPADAGASVDGVFHPPYIEVHLAAAERLDRPRLAVLKGGGGEAERNPAKPAALHLWRRGIGRREVVLPATGGRVAEGADFRAVWEGEAPVPAVVLATIGLGLIAAGRCEDAADADGAAGSVWDGRRVRTASSVDASG